MALPERLAAGRLTSSAEVTAYAVPRHTRVAVASLMLTNTSAQDVTVGAWATVGVAGGDPVKYPVMPTELVLGPGDAYHLTTPFTLEADEQLVLRSSDSGVWYYVTAFREGVLPSPSARAE